MNDIYVSQGYKNRKAYLKSLAEKYDIDYKIVVTIANTLGKSEDFDGLIVELNNYLDMSEN